MVIGTIPIKKNTKVTKNASLPSLLTPPSRVVYKLFCTFAANIQLKYVFIMARPIKETPVLKGKDVERFKYNLEHPTPVSAEEVTKARETYEKFKRITTFVL